MTPGTGRVELRLKKGKDGPDTLAIVRPDGTAEVQKLPNAFPIHDLTHYAVETVLGLEASFLGLVGAGWSIGDFGAPWPRGPLPAEAAWTEEVVGLFWQERWPNGIRRSVEEINEEIDTWRARLAGEKASRGPADPALLARRLTDDEVDRIRHRLGDLIGRWHALPPGQSLVLPFLPDAG